MGERNGRKTGVEAMSDGIQDMLISDVLTGGNHLASAMIGEGFHPITCHSYAEALEDWGQPLADMWVAWRSIMNLAEYRRGETAKRQGWAK